MLCGDLNEKEIQERGEIYIQIYIYVWHSLCYTAETNIMKQLYFNFKNNKNSSFLL